MAWILFAIISYDASNRCENCGRPILFAALRMKMRFVLKRNRRTRMMIDTALAFMEIVCEFQTTVNPSLNAASLFSNAQ